MGDVSCDGVGRSVTQRGVMAFPQSHRASTCARAASVSGSQNVMSISWYIALAVEISAPGISLLSLQGVDLTAPHDEHGRRDQTERAPPEDVIQPRILQVSGQTLIIDEQKNEHEDDRQ
jgi:hypothetical protein